MRTLLARTLTCLCARSPVLRARLEDRPPTVDTRRINAKGRVVPTPMFSSLSIHGITVNEYEERFVDHLRLSIRHARHETESPSSDRVPPRPSPLPSEGFIGR